LKELHNNGGFERREINIERGMTFLIVGKREAWTVLSRGLGKRGEVFSHSIS